MHLSMEFIVQILLILAILGGIVWAAERYLPIPDPLKGIALFVVIILGLLWLAQKIGAF